jgi:hypothetical protein
MKELSPSRQDDQSPDQDICRRCPKYEPSRRWCPLRAEQRRPAALACRYGIVLMGAARQEEHKK